MRDIATAVGFARKLGCSDSLLRNVESATIPLSEKLACRIEEVTGVSAKWLQSAPAIDDPILDSKGNVWSPTHSDTVHFSGRIKVMIDILWKHSPQSLPAFAGAVVHAALAVETSAPDSLQIQETDRMKRRRLSTSFIQPIIGLVQQLESRDGEKFFAALDKYFEGRGLRITANSDETSRFLNAALMQDCLITPLAARKPRSAGRGAAEPLPADSVSPGHDEGAV